MFKAAYDTSMPQRGRYGVYCFREFKFVASLKVAVIYLFEGLHNQM